MLTQDERRRRDDVCIELLSWFYEKSGDSTSDPERDSYYGLYRSVVGQIGEVRSFEAQRITSDAIHQHKAGMKNVRNFHQYFFGVCRMLAKRDGVDLQVNWKRPVESN